MGTVYVYLPAPDRAREKTTGNNLHPMPERPHPTMLAGRSKLGGEILIEASPKCDVEKLHPPADTQDRDGNPNAFPDHEEFKLRPTCIGVPQCRKKLLPVKPGVNIKCSPGYQNSADVFQEERYIPPPIGTYQGNSPCLFNGLEIIRLN